MKLLALPKKSISLGGTARTQARSNRQAPRPAPVQERAQLAGVLLHLP